MAVDHGLVPGAQGGSTVLLRELQPEGRRTRQKLRFEPASDQDPAQSHERRIASLRAELLPALSTGGSHGPAHRYFDVPSWFSLHRSGEQVAGFGLTILGARKRRRICLAKA